MHIPIEYIGYTTKKQSSDLIYIKILFKYLQEDTDLEKMIIDTRKRLGLHIPLLQSTGQDVVKKHALLRSEISIFKKKKLEIKPNPRVESYSFEEKTIEKEVDKIIKKYSFLKDWKTGIRKYILDNVFMITSYNTAIKLRVRNEDQYLGSFTDIPYEEGVKIVISSPITKKQLLDFYYEYKNIINSFLNQKNKLITLSKRGNFERDRMIVYLRKTLHKSWREIADIIQENTREQLSEETLQEAYKDFPFIK